MLDRPALEQLCQKWQSKFTSSDFQVRPDDYPAAYARAMVVFYKEREHVGFKWAEIKLLWDGDQGLLVQCTVDHAAAVRGQVILLPDGGHTLDDAGLLAAAQRVEQLYAEWLAVAPLPA